MDGGRQIIDDAQLWILEHGGWPRGRTANAAGQALQEYHKDLPEIVASSSVLLSQLGIDAHSSRTTTRRLLDSSTRELAGGGKEEYSPIERSEIMRRTLRDVLVQEAAGYELVRRGGVDPARALDRDPDRGQGKKAVETLRRQGVAIDDVLGHMTEHDLKKTSHGAYNKVSLVAHPHLTKTLETSNEVMSTEQAAINQQLNGSVDRYAVQPVRRFQPPAPARHPTFGRKMAAAQAMAAGISR